MIVGLIAAGQDPTEFKASSGASLIDGLLSYVNPKTNKFTYFGQDNELATEQGFRALIALEKAAAGSAYNIYDFSAAAVRAGRATGEGVVVTPPSPDESSSDINVTVTIKTDTETWLSSKTVTVKEGSTVYHAFVKALEDSGITQEGAAKGYVRSMTKNGVTLGEFTKGQNSGWLYKVNGQLPNVGLTQCSWENYFRFCFREQA